MAECDLDYSPPRIASDRHVITGGTFDKTHEETRGPGVVRRHAPIEMLRLGRSRVEAQDPYPNPLDMPSASSQSSALWRATLRSGGPSPVA